jgi:cellulose synthase/poly-beta-1,6-N-acetylglucosamine synthase-like glycosyltransferase
MITSIFTVLTLPLFLLLALFIIECLVALFPIKTFPLGRRPGCVVLIPAHNEALVLEKTLLALQPQLLTEDRILLVADNCTDETADIARGLGVDVLERVDLHNRGKGFTLDAGVRALAENPPEVVVVVDADCIVQPGSLDQLLRATLTVDGPVQALYLMNPPDNDAISGLVAAFAFILKNHVRARGLARLGFRVNLTGTGMAFPWRDISSADIANGNIVEDMAMGVELMITGRGANFVESALVTSVLPSTAAASETQRTRWEHGHLHTIITVVPKLIAKSLKLRRPDLLVNALDLAVPPLSLFLLINIVWLLVLLCVAFVSGQWVLFISYVLMGGLACVAVSLAWYRFARHIVSARALLAIPAYILGKLGIYRRFLRKRETQWVRTDRDS